MTTTLLSPEIEESPSTDAETLAVELPEPASGGGLAEGVAILLLMSVLQRGSGFLRGVIFCRWMDPAELGQWDMLRGFVFLVAPLAMLGIPGSFARYVERYRRRGQLRWFLGQTTIVCSVSAVAAAIAVWCGAKWVSMWLFGRPDHLQLIALGAIAVLAVAAHNFLVDVFTGLRDFRAVSALQFLSSILLTVVALTMMCAWRADTTVVILAFAISMFLSCVLVAPRLRSGLAGPRVVACDTGVWRRLAPYAAAIWVTNLLANSFDVVDRYMLVHLAPLSPDAALALVGDYHASRIIPLLAVGVATMISQVATPHLSCDWESGDRDRVGRRLNLMIKLTAGFLTMGTSVIVVVSPWLFPLAFGDKYSAGLAVLPWTMTYCVWSGLMMVAVSYLWCAEKAHLSTIALLVGLVVNVALNAALVPHFFLQGAVVATTTSHLVVLLLVARFGRWLGWQANWTVWMALLLPGLLLVHGWAGVIGSVLLFVIAWKGNWLLDREEKQLVATTMAIYQEKIAAAFFRGRQPSGS